MLVVRHAVVGPFAENTYVVGDQESREALLVDPGGELHRVLPLLQPEGLRVARIVLTHGHIDHVAGCTEAKAHFGCAAQIHEADRGWLAALPKQAEMFGFEGLSEPPVAEHLHADGDTFALGAQSVRVIHTPGHTQGSCCLWFEEARTLLTGDTLFAGSVGRTDLPGGDYEALARSIIGKLFPLGDAVRFHPGHGPSALLGDERRSNPFVGEAKGRARGFV